MINESTLVAIDPLLTKLNAANVSVVASNQTLLGALVQASNSPIVCGYQGESGFTEAWLKSLDVDMVFGVAGRQVIPNENGEMTTLFGNSLHSESMEEAATIVSTAVTTALGFTRNVVKPICATVIDGITAMMDEAQTVVEAYEIVDVAPLGVWDSPFIVGMLEKFESFKAVQPIKREDIPQLIAPANLEELLRSGNSQLDSAVEQILKETGLTPVDLFNSVFNSLTPVGQLPRQYWMERNLMLAQLVMVSLLADNPWPNMGISGTRWSSITSRMEVSLGIACNLMRKMQIEDTTNGVVVLGGDEKEGRIYVNGPCYENYLAGTGTPEVIIGGWIKTKSPYQMTPAKLESERDAFLQAWTSYHNARQYSQNAGRAAKLRTAINSQLMVAIDNLDPKTLKPGDTKVILVERVKARLNELKPHQMGDVGLTVIHVVCDCFFPHTPSKTLLLRINDLCKEGAEGEEAATQAAIEYVVDWLASMVIYS